MRVSFATAIATTLLAITGSAMAHSKGGRMAFVQSGMRNVSDAVLVRSLPGFVNRNAKFNGMHLHYVEGGKESPVILLPGWPETWWEFHKVMPALSRNHQVIAVDLRGMGGSSRPASGYDKKTMAADIAALVRQLGLSKVDVVGHDIGSQVAFAFAANYPDLTRKLVLLDVAPPDKSLASWPLMPAVGKFGDKIGNGDNSYAWWFAFHQVKGLPEQLMARGRIRIEQTWFFHYLTKDDRSIDARSRDVYAAAYATADAIRAGNAWYQAFPQDIIDSAGYAPLSMPVLALGGPGFNWLKSTMPAKSTNLEVVKIPDSGHFIPEEQPIVLLKALNKFLD